MYKRVTKLEHVGQIESTPPFDIFNVTYEDGTQKQVVLKPDIIFSRVYWQWHRRYKNKLYCPQNLLDHFATISPNNIDSSIDITIAMKK